MIKTTLTALAAIVAMSLPTISTAQEATYVVCYKNGVFLWYEEAYSDGSINSAYFRCINEGGSPDVFGGR
ncbi:hypothetical protein N473_02620 [Pseudoalteromonas luteoviolacea CPMOR-1]|uniref:Uncharacterized protein n=1 Tax=Pseudoalteromonas luteoviolacea CPMOR-1 TaxID=1365248 RepID=A0A161Y0C1_9GAMM|nr:hypothetical protein [Pseudoalteromonas luteoviolacea]KZN59826.1 hypothetical protein N473_02620 [Pseudoalteromonas luteoviolacea CPMOR-1]